MGVFRTITGAATGLVAAALAVESAPLIIGGAVAGAAINNAVGSSNDDDVRRKASREGFKEGHAKGMEENFKHVTNMYMKNI